MVSTQRRNPELVDILRPDFQARYEPNFAWKSACSALLGIPGLVGAWPMSVVGSVGGATSDATDISGQGRHLTNVGVGLYRGANTYAHSFIDFDGTNDYLNRNDEAGLDITGTEGYIATVSRGLTIGGWFRFDTIPFGNTCGVMSKFLTTGNQRSYLLFGTNATSLLTFRISVDGTAITSVASTYTLSQNVWYFCVGRFDPSTTLDIFIDGSANKDTLAVGVPASIFNSTANFNIGAYDNGLAATRLDGRASLCFLSQCYLEDFVIDMFFEQTRAMFAK